MIRREIRKKIKIKRIVRIRISRGKRRERKRKGSINLIFNIY